VPAGAVPQSSDDFSEQEGIVRIQLSIAVSAMGLQVACTPAGTPPEAEPVKQAYGSYTLERARSEGYVRDEFCLDAASFGQPGGRGAMGFHATDERLLRGPIDANRPQALMFDAEGRVLGVEYEVVADAVSEPPRLFGKTFAKLPAHPGVAHEHYALHLWFVDNPSGALADFNPRVSCPPGSTPAQDPGHAPQGH
jgi:hypothetical protein